MTIKEEIPHSSFLSVQKDLNILINSILANKNLQKLLYYDTPDCLSKGCLTAEQQYGLIGKNIKIIPKLSVDNTVLNYIIISFDNFVQNDTNPEFRDNVVEIDIICHFDQWTLNDMQLRPYVIAAEVDTMINKKHLSGIGQLQFLAASQVILNSEFAGLCLKYYAIHGGEDSVRTLSPQQEEVMLENFEDYLEEIEELPKDARPSDGRQ